MRTPSAELTIMRIKTHDRIGQSVMAEACHLIYTYSRIKTAGMINRSVNVAVKRHVLNALFYLVLDDMTISAKPWKS